MKRSEIKQLINRVRALTHNLRTLNQPTRRIFTQPQNDHRKFIQENLDFIKEYRVALVLNLI